MSCVFCFQLRWHCRNYPNWWWICYRAYKPFLGEGYFNIYVDIKNAKSFQRFWLWFSFWAVSFAFVLTTFPQLHKCIFCFIAQCERPSLPEAEILHFHSFTMWGLSPRSWSEIVSKPGYEASVMWQDGCGRCEHNILHHFFCDVTKEAFLLFPEHRYWPTVILKAGWPIQHLGNWSVLFQ